MLLSSSNEIGREEKHGRAAHNQSGLHDSGTLCEAGRKGGTQTLRQSLGKIILFRTGRSNHTTSDKPMLNVLRSSPEDSGFYDSPRLRVPAATFKIRKNQGRCHPCKQGAETKGQKTSQRPLQRQGFTEIGLSVCEGETRRFGH